MNTDMQQRIQAPIGDRNQSYAVVSNEAYGRSGYEAANSVGRPINTHPAVYNSGSGNYMPYMQHSHGKWLAQALSFQFILLQANSTWWITDSLYKLLKLRSEKNKLCN
jgi:hypothetical protein